MLEKCIHFSGKNKIVTAGEIKELLGIVEVLQISKLVDFIVNKNTQEGILHINSLIDSGVDLGEFTKTLIFYLRQSLLLKINPELLHPQTSGLSTEELSVMKEQIRKVNEKEIQKMLELFIEAENKMKYSSILQLPLELAIIEITYNKPAL